MNWPSQPRTIIQVEQSTVGDGEREYTLYKEGKPILSARCRGWHKRSNRLVYHGGSIEGTVNLLTPDASGLGEVKLTLQGLLSSNAHPMEEPTFWTFWTSSEVVFSGTSSNRVSLLSTGSPVKRREGGPWAFSITLPTDITVKTKSGQRRYPLPPSFRKSKSLAFLEYNLVITVSRGFMLEPLELRVPFSYEPSSYPEYPLWSTKSVASYISEGNELMLSGVAFGARPVTLAISTFLRQPLVYPRGDTVTITTLFECDDPQVLDVMASAEHLRIQLAQKVTAEGIVLSEVLREGSFDKAGSLLSPESLTSKQRTIEAHLTIPKTITVSFEFEKFIVEHFIDVTVRPDRLFVLPQKTRTEMHHRVQIVTERPKRPPPLYEESAS